MATLFKTQPGESEHNGGVPIPRYTRDLFGSAVETCSFCGEQHASGYWQGVAGVVSCCRMCARNVLPALAADCLCGDRLGASNRYEVLHGDWSDRMALVFWRACLVAVQRLLDAAGKGRSVSPMAHLRGQVGGQPVSPVIERQLRHQAGQEGADHA